MAFYYPQDVALDMGATAILPATQYYHSSEQAHRRTEQPLCGQAGTVTIVHYDLWHRAMPNRSDRDRFMVKFLFTRMSEPQAPSWDHRDGDWTAAANDPPAGLCRRAWDWMRGAEASTDGFRAGLERGCGVSCARGVRHSVQRWPGRIQGSWMEGGRGPIGSEE